MFDHGSVGYCWSMNDRLLGLVPYYYQNLLAQTSSSYGVSGRYAAVIVYDSL
jgi:Arc/MetJ family transcription regulator